MARKSGILLHISSLPSQYGIGDFGPQAYAFADFLAETKQRVWQILPLNPIDPAFGSSPYHSISAFGFNTLFISPERLCEDGLLKKEQLENVPQFPGESVEYPAVIAFKNTLFDAAFSSFKKKKNKRDFEAFCQKHSSWLDDFSLFVALKENFGGKPWCEWPQDVRDRQPKALQAAAEKLSGRVEKEKFLQYCFYTQWASLKEYCNKKGIKIIGDMPIYVDGDSVDIWTQPQLFRLDENKKPLFVAGVPPDYFSATGQLWGNPIYNWEAMKKDKFQWWVERLEHNFAIFDITRIDHFRGLVGYWQVPAGEATAVNGKWVAVPKDFFPVLCKQFSPSSVVAEDLGIITDDVREIIRRYRFPSMKVLLFAFGDHPAKNPYVPHNIIQDCIIYTGTHDNNTVRGWFESEARPEEKDRLFGYLGRSIGPDEIHWEFIRMAMMSVADTSIYPIQDVLGLNASGRMNIPSTADGNWRWRLTGGQLQSVERDRLRGMTEMYGRAIEEEPQKS